MAETQAGWQAAIVEIVQENWDKNARLTPLSYLGTALRQRPSAELPAELKLLDAAKSLSQIVAVQRPGHPLVWGLCPADVKPTGDLEALFHQPTAPRPMPPFKEFIWKAFKKEIFGDNVRVVDFGAEDFKDGPASDKPLGSKQKIVQRSEQLPPDDRQDREKMISHVSAWLEKNNLTAQGMNTIGPGVASLEQRPASDSGKRSLLTLLLERLSEKDLQRLSFPMDVVEKLRKIEL